MLTFLIKLLLRQSCLLQKTLKTWMGIKKESKNHLQSYHSKKTKPNTVMWLFYPLSLPLSSLKHVPRQGAVSQIKTALIRWATIYGRQTVLRSCLSLNRPCMWETFIVYLYESHDFTLKQWSLNCFEVPLTLQCICLSGQRSAPHWLH